MQKIIKLIATLFYVGYMPLLPGTAASLLTLLGYYFFLSHSFYLYAATTLFLIVLGFLVCGRAEKLLGQKDSPRIVIDEVCGMLISLFLIPTDLVFMFLAFILFRIFDIVKVSPAAAWQKRTGASGVMGDDIIAGVYTNLCLHLVYWLANLA